MSSRPYCTGGRRINNGDPDWPRSLQGRAKRAYDFYEAPEGLGYKVRAEILNYPTDPGMSASSSGGERRADATTRGAMGEAPAAGGGTRSTSG